MPQRPLPLVFPAEQPRRDREPTLPLTTTGLPRLEYIARQGAALHPTPLAPQRDVVGLNLTRGCAHRCAFCSARAAPGAPGDGTLLVYEDTVRQVDEELTSGLNKPRAVYVSPSTDPFPPLPEIQSLTADVTAVLAWHGVQAWLMTRGYVRPAIAARLAEHRRHVKVTVPLTTLDRSLQRALEPLTASPSLRLRQIEELRDVGLAVHVAIDPLIPHLTDTRENLEPLLDALAEAGVTQVSASYLFLREGIVAQMRRGQLHGGLVDAIEGAYRGGPLLAPPGLATARYLPRPRRQRGYSHLMATAATRGIAVQLSSLTNPDFSAPPKHAPTGGRAPLGLRAMFDQMAED